MKTEFEFSPDMAKVFLGPQKVRMTTNKMIAVLEKAGVLEFHEYRGEKRILLLYFKLPGNWVQKINISQLPDVFRTGFLPENRHDFGDLVGLILSTLEEEKKEKKRSASSYGF